jgi:4-alpha-glucanotransferase
MLRDAHHTPSYFHINLLQEILLLFPELSWPNLEEERINIPGALLPTNWTYRFRPYVEEIVESQGLRDVFKYKILGSAH